MIPLNPDWRKGKGLTYRKDLVEWVDSHPEASFYDLWEEAIDPEWLPHLAQVGGAERQELILAACAVARLCLHLIPPGENRPRIAIETAEAYTRESEGREQAIKARDVLCSHCEININNSNPHRDAIYAVSTASYSAIFFAFAHPHFFAAYAADTAYWVLQAGVESKVVCATLRKHLNFERPREKGLTVWQRLAKREEE